MIRELKLFFLCWSRVWPSHSSFFFWNTFRTSMFVSVVKITDFHSKVIHTHIPLPSCFPKISFFSLSPSLLHVISLYTYFFLLPQPKRRRKYSLLSLSLPRPFSPKEEEEEEEEEGERNLRGGGIGKGGGGGGNLIAKGGEEDKGRSLPRTSEKRWYFDYFYILFF